MIESDVIRLRVDDEFVDWAVRDALNDFDFEDAIFWMKLYSSYEPDES